MRRFLRILINALTILSLLLCVGTCVLWMDSYRAYARLELGNPGGASFSVASDAGRIGISRTRYNDEKVNPLYPAPGRQIRRWYRITNWVGRNWGPGGWTWGGFALQRGVPAISMDVVGGRQIGTIDTVRAPYWFLTAVTILLPGRAVARAARRLRRRVRAGHCPTCGYDLRATPDRCPECGAGSSPTKAVA